MVTFDSTLTKWDSTLHTFDETGTGNVIVFPGVSELTLTGYAPVVTVSGGPVTVSPGVAELLLTGYRPTISVTHHGLVEDVRVQPFYEVIRKIEVDDLDVTALEVFQ
jgi:hypothetical protein